MRLPRGHGNARVFLGAFATGVVRHPAAASLVVDVPGDRPSCYTLRDVPAGHWHLLAVAVAAGTGHDPHAVRTELTAHGPATAVTVTAGDVTSAAVRLARPTRPTRRSCSPCPHSTRPRRRRRTPGAPPPLPRRTPAG